VPSQTARWPITETAQQTNTNNNGQGTGQNKTNTTKNLHQEDSFKGNYFHISRKLPKRSQPCFQN
jgi:hypothetical protein